MKTLLLYLFAFIAILIVSCEKDVKTTTGAVTSTSQNAAQITYLPYLEHTAQPQQTDASITTASAANITQYAYLPVDKAARKSRLFIFLPGTAATPYYYRKIVQTAASQGYYAFGIAYSNMTNIDDYINSGNDDYTIKNILAEYFTGNNTSPIVTVPKQNGFVNRITKMILYMNSQYPSENWKQFLAADNSIIWSKIVIAGHSQGSDHVMYISQLYNVFRAAFFGGPGNFVLANGKYPVFMLKNGATARASVYGLNHTADYVRPWNNVQKVWSILKMSGNNELVDDGVYDGKFRFYSSLPVNDGHSAIVYDSEIPNDANNRPVYEPVWINMCFPK